MVCDGLSKVHILLCSLGGAIFGSAVYVGELFCGNVAYMAILKGISWRWPVVMCGVAVTVMSAAVALLIKEPPVGRFINQKKVYALHSYQEQYDMPCLLCPL